MSVILLLTLIPQEETSNNKDITELETVIVTREVDMLLILTIYEDLRLSYLLKTSV